MTIEELSARLDQKQIGLEQRFDRIDERFDVVEQRLNEADKRFDRIDEKLGELTQTVIGLRTDFKSLDQSHQSLVQSFLSFRTEVINRFQMVDMRLDMLTGVTTSLDVRLLPFSKAMLELGETANRLQQEQVRISKLVEPAA